MIATLAKKPLTTKLISLAWARRGASAQGFPCPKLTLNGHVDGLPVATGREFFEPVRTSTGAGARRAQAPVHCCDFAN